MMFKKSALLISVSLGLVLSGCASTEPESGLTAEQVAKMDRNEYVGQLHNEMEAVGFEVPAIDPVIDKVTVSIKDVFEHQYKVMDEYRAIAEDHRDVQSFLHANEGRSPEELSAAILAFDSQLKEGEEPIGKRIVRYTKANDEIFNANIELAANIASNAYLLSEMMEEGASHFLSLSGLSLLLKVGEINDAWDTAQKRVDLALKANDMISKDQAVVKIAQELQEVQSIKL
ncbi:hypothetical protein [Ferrimonas sp.]|uniref:hypothetical protein n=1 Tax=Ferrimonas sp. TaxID=2080861 RepID=UPI003A8E9FF4